MQSGNLEIIVPALLIPLLIFFLWRFRVKRVASYQSPFLGKIEVLEKYNKEKVLTIKFCPQGVSINDKSILKSYWYYIAQKVSDFCQNRKNPKILLLGMGACTIPHLIARSNPSIRQTIVELDPLIIQACRDCFDLDQLPALTVKTADVYKLADDPQAFPQKFDCLVVDLYTGDPPYVSPGSNKPHFITKILSWLKKDGVIIFNRPGHTESAREVNRELKKYLETVFLKAELAVIKDPRGYQNNIILAFGKTTHE